MTDKSISLYDILPGVCQGLTRVMISYPFDYIRLLYQTDKAFQYNKNMIGINLYRGVIYPLMITPLDRGIQFLLFDLFRQKELGSLSSALLAATCGSIYNTPMQYMITNTIMRNKIQMGNSYRGYTPELLRNIGMSTMFMGVYDMVRTDGDSKIRTVLNGAYASLASWTIFYPLDTMRVLYQGKGMLDRNRPILSYWRGIHLVYMRALPSAGIGMLVYEIVKRRITQP